MRALPALALAVLAAIPLADAVPAAQADPAPRPPAAAVLDRVERHAVAVVLRFRKDLEAEAVGAVGVDPDAPTEIYRRWRMSVRVPGFLVGDLRTVLCSDVHLPAGAVKSVEVVSRTGKAVPARIDAFLRRAGGIVVRTEQDVEGEALAFPETAPVTPETPLFVGSLAEGQRGLEVWAEPLGAVRRRGFGAAGLAYGPPEKRTAGLGGSGLSRTADLVLLGDATPVGFRLGGGVDLGEALWTGRDVLAEVAAAVPFASLGETAAKLARDSYVHQVRILYRPLSAEEESGEAPLSYVARLRAPGEPDDDAKHYGLAIAPDALVVPETLPEAWIARIDRVIVEDAGRAPVEARFVGRVKGFGAFVVRLVDGVLPALGAERPPAPAADGAFYVHVVGWRAGARRDLVDYDRSAGFARGYGDRDWFTSEEPVPAGAFLLSLEGHVLGFAADLVPEDLEPSPSRQRRGEEDGTRGVQAALFARLGTPSALASDLDLRVMPRKGEDARRQPWLGVEYEPVRGTLVAAALGASGPTRDGQRGLVVNHVYAGSPAERAGIRRDDILVWARRTSGPGADAPPVDLADTSGAPEWTDESEVPRPWRPRGNALVRQLASFGVGAGYELGYVREGATKTATLTVEQAPRDVTSARRAKDAGTGLTVRELTYEVRVALHLGAEAPGVLVSDVQEGSAAFQARVLANEVVREVDGHAVVGPEGFSDLLAAARAAGRDPVRLVVMRLDRSRFVDLPLAAPEPTAEGATGDGAIPPSPPGESPR